MITSSSLADRYTMMPDPKTVSYAVRTGANAWEDGVDVEYFERRNPGWKDMQANQQFATQTTLVWFGWRIPLNGIAPKQGDRITHNSETWIVQTVFEELLGNRFRLFCTKGK